MRVLPAERKEWDVVLAGTCGPLPTEGAITNLHILRSWEADIRVPAPQYHNLRHNFRHILLEPPRFYKIMRHPCRPFSLCWECITGPVSPGESSESGAVRLASETIGLNLDREKGALIASMFGHDAVIDAWLFVEETDISSLTLNNEEAVDARWMLPFEIRRLYRDGRLVPELSYHDRVFSYIRPGSVF